MANEQEPGGAARGLYESSGGGGGGGGKLRTTRSTRRSSATPYDRPQTGRNASAAVRASSAAARSFNDNISNNNVRSWLARIVDPASRIITNSCRRWFPSAFRNPLMVPPVSQSNTDVHDDVLQEVAEDVENAMITEVIDKEQGAGSVENQRNESQVTVLDEIYKDKTISREEFNRTIEFLKTKVIDDSSGMKHYEGETREECIGGDEPINATNVEAQRWREERKKTREEKDNSFWDDRLFSNALSHVATQTVREDAGSSPADIAKAFMGVRSRRVSTSALPVPRTSTLSMRDEITPNKLFGDECNQQISNCNLLIPRTREGLVFGNRQADDSFKAAYDYRHKNSQFVRSQSRAQGSTCIPCDRNSHQQSYFERIGDGLPTSKPAFRWMPIQSPSIGRRQMLKRRSSALADGLTSIDTTRRTRQKSSLNTPLCNSNPSCSDGNRLNPLLSPGNDSMQNALTSAFRKPVETVKQIDLSVFKYQKDAITDMGASLVKVPQKSCETAQKIFEQLDRMVPSPKENSEAQLAIARARIPTSMSINMLDGHAHRRIDTINFHVPGSSPHQKNNQSVAQGAAGYGQKYEGKVKSLMFNSVQTFGGAPASSDTGDVARQNLNASSSKVHNQLEVLDGSLTVPEKIKGFQMSAHEESDEEGHCTRNATLLSHSHVGNTVSTSQGNITDSKISKLDIGIKSAGTILTTKAEANSQTLTSSLVESSTNNDSGYTFLVGPGASNLSEAGNSTLMPSPMMKVDSQPVMETVIPIFNFGSGSTSRGPVFSFSTSGCTEVDFTKPEFDFKFESKPEASFSTAVAAAAAASASTVPLKTTCGLSETSVSIFKVQPTMGLSGNLSSALTSSTEISSTIAKPVSSIPLFGGFASKIDAMNPVSFSSSEMRSSTAMLAISNRNMTISSSSTEVGGSSLCPDNFVKISTSGEKSMVKSGNKVEGSILLSSPCFGLTNASEIISSNRSGISNFITNLLPDPQSPFTGSFFGQASSCAPVDTSASLVRTSMFSASLSNSLPSASLFSSNSSVSCGGTRLLLFGSTSATTASGSTSSFGSSAPSLFSSASFPSFGLSKNSFSSNISGTFASSTSVSESDTSSTFCAASNPSLGFGGTSFTGSSAPTFSASSIPRFVSNNAALFGLSTTPQFGSSTSSLFGSNTSLSVESSSSSFGSNTSPSFGSCGATVYANDMERSFASGPTFSFGSGSSSSFGGSSPLFGSCSSNSSVLGGSSVAFGSANCSPLSGSSGISGFGSTPASRGSGSSFGSASIPLFGTSTTPQFGLAQSFGASSASQSTMPLFGSRLGGSPALASSGSSSGVSTAASSSSFAIGTMRSTSSGTTFSSSLAGASPGALTFGSKDMSMSPQQSVFGLTNTISTFGTSSSTPTDRMEDSMSEDPVQISSAPVFGGQIASLGTSFMFASQSRAPLPGESVFQFGAQSSPAAGVQSTFNPSTGGPQFSGGSFSLGAGGEKPGRKFIKAKRDKGRRK